MIDGDKYKQIVTKIYAQIRFVIYQQVKSKNASKTTPNGHPTIIPEQDLHAIVNQVDVEQIRQDVFKLYQIEYGLDT